MFYDKLSISLKCVVDISLLREELGCRFCSHDELIHDFSSFCIRLAISSTSDL